MLLCNFHREQAWGRWLSTVANEMRMHKAMVLVFLRRIAESQTEINFENNIKDFMESEIWQHEHSKKLRDWFSKTWPPCHKVLFIWVFMLMQSSFNHLMNQLMEFTDFQQFYEKLYTSIFIRLSHCQHFYAENVKKLEMLECIWILSCKMFFQKEILSE